MIHLILATSTIQLHGVIADLPETEIVSHCATLGVVCQALCIYIACHLCILSYTPQCREHLCLRTVAQWPDSVFPLCFVQSASRVTDAVSLWVRHIQRSVKSHIVRQAIVTVYAHFPIQLFGVCLLFVLLLLFIFLKLRQNATPLPH